MASSFKPKTRTYVAGGTIPAYSFVKFDTTAPASSKNPRVVSCTSGKSHGIGQNSSQVTIGQEIEVALPGGGALLTLVGTVVVGNSILASTGGAGAPVSSAGDYVGAQAVEGGVSGDVIGVDVVQWQKQSSDIT